MYHFVVKRLIARGFRRLSRGDYRAITGLMADDCHYHFVGTHALGGHRNSRRAIELWFQRFLRLFPGFQFAPEAIVVEGWPWSTNVATKLRVHWRKPDGSGYQNVALQWVRIRWFKAIDVLTADDSQAVAALLRELAERYDMPEALAPSLEDQPAVAERPD